MAVLDIQNLQVSYRSRRGIARAVRDVSLSIEEGETYGLVGESGCGKSTVALSIMRYLPRQAEAKGKILFKDQDLMQASEDKLRALRGNRIAMVYQDPQASLNPMLTIGRQLAEVLTTHLGSSPAEAQDQVVAMLERVRMPDPTYILQRYPHQLSGGMQQRVMIAMALLLNPELVVMDEPTTGLDVTVEANVLDLLDTLRNEFRMAVLYISHNLNVVSRICDRVGVMYAGELVEQARREDLFQQSRHPYTVSLLRCLPQQGTHHSEQALYSIPGRVPPLTDLPPGCIFAPRCPLADASCTAHHPALESVGDGHLTRCFHWQALGQQPELVTEHVAPQENGQAQSSGELMKVNHLKVYYKQASGLLASGGIDIKSVDDVSFTMRPQQTLGIVGESGCGKSTIARALAGLTPITDGDVLFDEHDFSQPVERRGSDALKQIQMVFQNPDSTLNPRHSIRRALSRPLRLFQGIAPEREEETIISLLRSVNLDESYLDRLPKQLSGGEKQRVAIARALAGNPQLVLCDEPISSLDVSVQAAVLNLLRDLQAEREVALLFISHDLNVVRYLSDQIVVIYLGRVCESGPSQAIFEPPFHPYTEGLVSAMPETADANSIRLEGTVPSPANPPTGCRFHTRCPRKIGTICESEAPPRRMVSEGHHIHCHIPLNELVAMQQTTTVS